MRAFLLFLIGIGGILLVLFAAFCLQRRRIDRKWQREQAEFARTGQISPTRNHTSFSWETFLAILVCVLAFVVIMLVFRSLLADLHDQIVLSERELREECWELRREVELLRQEQKAEQSLLSSLTVTPEHYDPASGSVLLTVSLTPKEQGNDTTLSLRLGEKRIETVRDGDTFTAQIERALFANAPGEETPITVTVTTNGISRTETVDPALFSDAKQLTDDIHDRFLPVFAEWDWGQSQQFVRKGDSMVLDFGTVRFSFLKPRCSDVTLSSLRLRVVSDGKTLYEEDISSHLLPDDPSMKVWQTDEFSFYSSVPCGEDTPVILWLYFNDSLGNETKKFLMGWNADDPSYPSSVLTDKDGNVLLID